MHALLFALALQQAPAVHSGEDVIRAMHDRYAGKWYTTLSFVQHNTATRPNGAQEHSTWREYARIPGRLRIDFLPADSGNGLLFASDTEYVRQADTLGHLEPLIHPLMVLGFDVYAQPVATSIAKLRALGIDLSQVHEDSWEGRPAYVVGARSGDLRTRQFWIEKERLLFVRMLEPGRRDTTRTTETRFESYRAVGPAWVSPRVEFLVDGRQVWLEEYDDIMTDKPIADSLFAPPRRR
jgi:hypothetical protein